MFEKRDKLGRYIKVKYIPMICKICNKRFKVVPCRKNTAKFCSPKCSQIYHSGKNHHSYGKSPSIKTKTKISNTLTGKYRGEKGAGWKGGKRKHTEGYILIYCPSHPHAMQKYVPEHRLIIEKHIGRYLDCKEIPHHINGIKDDNQIENLYLFSTGGKHISYHMNVRYNNIKPITKSNLL